MCKRSGYVLSSSSCLAATICLSMQSLLGYYTVHLGVAVFNKMMEIWKGELKREATSALTEWKERGKVHIVLTRLLKIELGIETCASAAPDKWCWQSEQNKKSDGLWLASTIFQKIYCSSVEVVLTCCSCCKWKLTSDTSKCRKGFAGPLIFI